ncbi:type II toxin-antitoxin system YafQ family toxin [Candidatus Peregrinibacteria bacterium]|nr:type II toxin-antitoxin system YafQ family toxin [Candidatus Peregrinibacteria bacterium]
MPMLTIVTRPRYERDFRRFLRSPQAEKFLPKLRMAILHLQERKALPIAFRDHALKGRLQGLRECHIDHDLLLVYQVIEKRLELALLRLCDHDALRTIATS